MSGNEEGLADLLGDEPTPQEVLVDEAPKSRPMGANARAVLERSRSYPVNRVVNEARNSPVLLKRLLSYIAEMPVATDACRRAGISYSQLKYKLQKSLEGGPGDGFDVELGPDDGIDEPTTIRFHEAWDDFMAVGVGRTEVSVHQRATGYWEVGTYQGKVQYQLDPDKVELALFMGDEIDERDPKLWLRDEFGAPVPQRVWKMDPDLAMFVLKTRKADVYGNKAQLDVNVKGGVLAIPMQMPGMKVSVNELEENYRKSKTLPQIAFEESDDDDDDDSV